MTRFRSGRRHTAPRHDVARRSRGACAAPASGSASHARLSKVVSRLPNAPRLERPRAPRRPVRAALWTVDSSAVRPVARTPEAPPSVLRSRAGAHITYKGAPPLCLARRAASSSCAPPAPRRRRPSRGTQGLIGRVSQPRRPPPSLAPASAHRLVPLSHRAATSPKKGSRRPPPAVATARSCRRCLRPDSAWRSSLGDPELLSGCPRPATPTGPPEFR
jgi:hypothetical protein